MKSDNRIWYILLVVFLIIGALEINLWRSFNDIENKRRQNNTATYTDSDNTNTDNTSDTTYTFDNLNGGNELVQDENNYKYIFVGDSRYVGMAANKTSSDVFICEKGVGRYFLQKHMNDIVMLSDSNTKIIVGLGVNDVSTANVEMYVSLLNELNEKTSAKVYYMLVNPVNEDKCRRSGYTSIKNSNINTFNSKMIASLSDTDIKIIDTNTFLNDEGFNTGDGLHYDDETYTKIYQYIKLNLKYY